MSKKVKSAMLNVLREAGLGEEAITLLNAELARPQHPFRSNPGRIVNGTELGASEAEQEVASRLLEVDS